ncbi:DUF2388 domain-containing protein [Pseudomonas sp. ZM23]|uniref:DUF2388 domain-containing protein n=1 Tax=Pseudomonas triclosanedens TaxID=2961893 RepID=A0ABY6ZYC1_9PSED|nr:DUF2388 domain-containing protein [Pseudomonas triclosanedens]MCP8462565.1 DUF2388 domain-containing protein [Pseudomonas triclosanedens]MCP8468203.1 DUF2388 domain-containing protein [Pseudomonas triclosanedens]MCP8474962.1 DUF2388 domain-containing protein [Pseudomonas triclosanedens]WAI49756.1 DUF2388 domain-containing protein [Pseudomonas triclosanedens]
MRLSSISKSPLIVGLLLAACASSVQAQSVIRVFNITTNAFARSIDFTSDTTTSIRDMKVVQEARDDAASFVGSDGAIRGAQLEAAFKVLREDVPQARDASDQALAEAILAL